MFTVYTFRGTSNDFIHRFQSDYQAKADYLVENYRSSGAIIAAANAMISPHYGRLKAEHPIRINHSRQSEPVGGRWQRMDILGQGKVQILSVPRDAVGQAVVAMNEIARLKALDPDGDWSDFAVLARNRATLDPIRAWCHHNSVPYRLIDQDSAGPKFHQTREACLLLDVLRRKPSRLVSPVVLSRWFALRFSVANGANPWMNLLAQFIDELNCVWSDIAIPASTVIEALHEFGADAARSERGQMTLSTVHSAKGREFRHVVILDGGDWKSAEDDERRLYYVGMTRAKENLLLCQSVTSANPFTGALVGNEGIVHLPLPDTILRPEVLAHRFVALSLADVDLGFAGRRRGDDPVHSALTRLDHGSMLEIHPTERGLELRVPGDGIAIGKLAKRCVFETKKIVEVRVEAIIRRYKKQSDPKYVSSVRVEAWWVPLVTVHLG